MSLKAEPKLVAPERREEDAAESSLRPQRLAEFIGQEQARKNLGIFIGGVGSIATFSASSVIDSPPNGVRPTVSASYVSFGNSVISPS